MCSVREHIYSSGDHEGNQGTQSELSTPSSGSMQEEAERDKMQGAQGHWDMLWYDICCAIRKSSRRHSLIGGNT